MIEALFLAVLVDVFANEQQIIIRPFDDTEQCQKFEKYFHQRATANMGPHLQFSTACVEPEWTDR